MNFEYSVIRVVPSTIAEESPTSASWSKPESMSNCAALTASRGSRPPFPRSTRAMSRLGLPIWMNSAKQVQISISYPCRARHAARWCKSVRQPALSATASSMRSKDCSSFTWNLRRSAMAFTMLPAHLAEVDQQPHDDKNSQDPVNLER